MAKIGSKTMKTTNAAVPQILRGFELSLSLALALAASGLAACSTTSPAATSPADASSGMGDVARTDSTEIAADDPAAAHSDEQVTNAILAKLHNDPDPQLKKIEVSTAEGVVTLTGNVGTAQARNVAVRIADDTLGVVNVHDDLVVETETEQSP